MPGKAAVVLIFSLVIYNTVCVVVSEEKVVYIVSVNGDTIWEGNPNMIMCCRDLYPSLDNETVSWTQPPSGASFSRGHITTNHADGKVTICETLSFESFTENDAGMYVCSYFINGGHDYGEQKRFKFQRACLPGKYGLGCTQNCSEFCKEDEISGEASVCNYTNGDCPTGCQSGYSGANCSYVALAKGKMLQDENDGLKAKLQEAQVTQDRLQGNLSEALAKGRMLQDENDGLKAKLQEAHDTQDSLQVAAIVLGCLLWCAIIILAITCWRIRPAKKEGYKNNSTCRFYKNWITCRREEKDPEIEKNLLDEKKTLQEDNDRLTKTHQDDLQKLQGASEELKKMRGRLETQGAENNTLSDRVEELETQNNLLQKEKKETESKMSEERQTLEKDKNSRIEEVEAEKSELEKELQDVRACMGLLADKSPLQDEIDGLKTDLQLAQLEAQGTQTKLEKQGAENNKMRDRIEELEAQNNSLQEEKKAMEAKMSLDRQTLEEDKNKGIKETEAKKSELERQLQVVNTRIDKTEDELAQSKDKVISLTKDKLSLEFELNTARNSLEDSESKIKCKTEELNELRKENEELRTEKARQEGTQSAQREEISRLQTRIQENDQRMIDGESILRTLENEKSTLQGEIERLENHRERLESDIRHRQAMTEEKERRIELLTGQANDLKEMIKNQERLINELTQRLKDMAWEKEKAVVGREDLQRELNTVLEGQTIRRGGRTSGGQGEADSDSTNPGGATGGRALSAPERRAQEYHPDPLRPSTLGGPGVSATVSSQAAMPDTMQGENVSGTEENAEHPPPSLEDSVIDLHTPHSGTYPDSDSGPFTG